MTHICICGDCPAKPYDDTCQYEVVLKSLVEALDAGLIAPGCANPELEIARAVLDGLQKEEF